jgi:hypothetical protein
MDIFTPDMAARVAAIVTLVHAAAHVVRSYSYVCSYE